MRASVSHVTAPHRHQPHTGAVLCERTRHTQLLAASSAAQLHSRRCQRSAPPICKPSRTPLHQQAHNYPALRLHLPCNRRLSKPAARVAVSATAGRRYERPSALARGAAQHPLLRSMSRARLGRKLVCTSLDPLRALRQHRALILFAVSTLPRSQRHCPVATRHSLLELLTKLSVQSAYSFRLRNDEPA